MPADWRALARLAPLAAMLLAGCPTRSPPPAGGDDGGALASHPRIILFIGDGMGPVEEEVASRFAYGVADGLEMDSLPRRGQIMTASFSGLTDSAASATTLASGVETYNGRIAVTTDDEPVQTVTELAHSLGMVAGVVTTTSLPHATPAAFSAHQHSRGQLRAIAEDQVREVRPEVMLGGGSSYYAADLENDLPDLVPELQAAGYRVVSDAAGLAAIDPASTPRLFGAFASSHLPWVLDRADSETVPDLPAMTLAALEVLDRDPDGFFLMVEGGRIDHAGHANRLADNIAETLEFDRAIAAARTWAAARDQVTLIVTADHETGGLALVAPAPPGELPEVAWRWGQHTNRRVGVYAEGVATAALDGALGDQRMIHAALVAAITGEDPEAPPRLDLASGNSAELRELAATQTAASDFGGRGALDALRIDADERALTVGIDGTFSWGDSALVLLVDRDFGAGSGAAALRPANTTSDDPVDKLLARLGLSGNRVAGFGADFAAVSIGGAISRISGPLGAAGWRALLPSGEPDLATAGAVIINYDDFVRDGVAATGSGTEVQIPWSRLYPGGVIEPGAVVAVAAVLVSADGSEVSNQALPPLAGPARLSGVAAVAIDSDGDGAVDGEISVSRRSVE